MTFKSFLSIAVFATLISSCGLIWEYRSLNELEGMEWDNTTAQTFDFSISETGNYKVEIIGRHITGFQFKNLTGTMTIKGGSIMLENEFTIPIIGEDDMYLNEGGGDLWDFTFPAITSTNLPAGDYTATINHTMEQNPLGLVMEIGMQVDKAK
jgi:gliding motility-associated lipoprotein GldH